MANRYPEDVEDTAENAGTAHNVTIVGKPTDASDLSSAGSSGFSSMAWTGFAPCQTRPGLGGGRYLSSAAHNQRRCTYLFSPKSDKMIFSAVYAESVARPPVDDTPKGLFHHMGYWTAIGPWLD